jgi:hypothetical protein
VLQLSLNRQGMKSWQTKVARIDPQGIPHLDRAAKSPHGTSGSAVIEDYDPPYPQPFKTGE